MSALSIQPTYPIFTDTNGQPLEGGYIWIGAAGLNPQTNPITVYWDAALTQIAAQPVRTLAGYPVNNGTPARLYVNSDYSIRVTNRNGSLVSSAPTALERYSRVVTGAIDASVVTYTQVGTVDQTVADKLGERRSLLDFMSAAQKADVRARTALLDVTDAIQAAFNSGEMLEGIPGRYRVGTLSYGSNFSLIGPGIDTMEFVAETGLNGDIIRPATAPTTINVSSIAHSGTNTYATVTTASAHPYAVGDWVCLVSTDGVTDLDYYIGWREVESVADNTHFTFTCLKDAPASGTGTYTVFKSSISNVKMAGFSISGDANTYNGIEIDGVDGFSLSGIKIYGTAQHAFAMLRAVNGDIDGCRAEDVSTTTQVGFLFGASSGGYKYASNIELTKCFSSGNGQDGFLVEEGANIGFAVCRAFDNGTTASNGTGFKIGDGRDLRYVGCTSARNGAGYKAQAAWARVSYTGCQAFANQDSGWMVSTNNASVGGKDVSIVGCTANNNGQVGTSSAYGFSFDPAGNTISGVVFAGNTAKGNGRGLSFGTTGTISNVTMGGNNLRGNTADAVNGGSLQKSTLTIFGDNPAVTGSSSQELSTAQVTHAYTFSALNISGTTAQLMNDGTVAGLGIVIPKAAWLVGFRGKTSAALTAGLVSLSPRKNGSVIGSGKALTSADGTTFSSFEDYHVSPSREFAAGDILTFTYQPDASLSPSGSIDITVTVLLVF